jgi:hypothetical protein
MTGAVRRIGLAATFAVVAQSAAGAQAPESLERIRALLARPDVLCGQFAQAKTLVGLQRAVKSSGRFCVVAGQGILWRTLRPFPSDLRLTRDEIVESRDGVAATRMSAAQEPTVRMINDLLFSLLAGDMQRLTATFDVAATIDGSSWQATLAPKAAGMQRVIAGIELGGGEYVGHISIRETSGDRTAITFTAIATGKGAMLPEEARQFE